MNKIAVTIGYLLDNVAEKIKLRAKTYRPQFIRYRRNRWVYKVGDYLVRIKVLRIPKLLKNSLSLSELNRLRRIRNRDIMVSCTCKFWKWNGPDFHAADQDYNERSFSDLSAPNVRDPEGHFLICKHVCSALRQFKKDFSIAE